MQSKPSAYQEKLANLIKKKSKRADLINNLLVVDEFSAWALKHNYLENLNLKQLRLEIDNKKLELKYGIFSQGIRIIKQLSKKIIAFRPLFFSKKINPATENQEPLSPLQRYIIVIGIIIIVLLLGYGVYNNFFIKVERPFAYPSAPITGKRILSFQGRLTDSIGNPINTAAQITFKLWKVKHDQPEDDPGVEGTCTGLAGEDCLYSTGICSITPDSDGIFSTLIGDSCGAQIPASVFSENQNIYRGITVGADPEMTPRKQIANVGYAINAETLQGLPPGDNLANIPFINQNGDLLIAAATPGIRATNTSANFTISSAKALLSKAAIPC
jgi:hypothetical protein